MYQDMPAYMQVPLFTMPATAQVWSLIVYVVAGLATLAWAAVRGWRSGSIKPVLYVVSGGLTCFLEPIFARLADATHAQTGQITAFQSLGLLIPWHAAISYTFYFGLAYVLLVTAFRERVYTVRQIWMILIAITVSAWIYEVPFILVGLWAYYGNQPYQLFPSYYLQPLWWSAGSAAMLLTPVTLLARIDDRLTGWRQWLILPIGPMAAIGGAAAVCWPTWIALNSPAGEGVRFLAATLTILFTGIVIWLIAPLVAKDESDVPAADRMTSLAVA